MEKDLFSSFPLTLQFISKPEFSEISDLYFKNFPDEQDGYYLPSLLKSLSKDNKIPDYLSEIADVEISISHLRNQNFNFNKFESDLEPGFIQLSPALSIHRLNYDILSFLRSNHNIPPIKSANLLVASKSFDSKKINFFKAGPEEACIIDYLAEGGMNLRLLSVQLERNFNSLFPSYKKVLEIISKLKKKYIVLEK